MSAAPVRVQVFSLGLPQADVPKERRRYRVKWRVSGRDRTRSFKTRAEADRFRAALLGAIAEGLIFDPAAGLPVRWLPTADGPTWWAWSQEWLALKWPQWSGHSRRTAVETLTILAPLVVRPNAPKPPGDLATWLRTSGYRVGGPVPAGPEPAWLERWSIPLADIQPPLLEAVLTKACTRADGAATVASVSRRRRNQLATMLRAAVRRGVLATNPMDRVEWRIPQRSLEVDVTTVPSPADVRAVVERISSPGDGSARYAGLFACVGLAGMRPSEAIALDISDVDLPATGWGSATLRGAVTSPGTRYTPTGEVTEVTGLKQRARDVVRDVPLPPGLVSILHEHVRRFPPVGGRLFTNAAGRPVTSTNYGPIWTTTRAALWPAGHPLASSTVYDLRHGAASMMLRAGVPAAEVARRLGHSVDVLMRVYAGVFDDERDRSNALIDAALGAD